MNSVNSLSGLKKAYQFGNIACCKIDFEGNLTIGRGFRSYLARAVCRITSRSRKADLKKYTQLVHFVIGRLSESQSIEAGRATDSLAFFPESRTIDKFAKAFLGIDRNVEEDFFSFLQQLPYQERTENITENINRLCKNFSKNSSCLKSWLNSIRSVPAAARSGMIGVAIDLSSKNCTSRQIAQSLQRLVSIICQFDREENQKSVCDVFLRLSRADQENLFEKAAILFAEFESEQAKINVLKSLSCFPARERDEFIRTILPVLLRDKDRTIDPVLCKAIAQIPLESRTIDAVLAIEVLFQGLGKELLDRRMSAEERKAIVNAIKLIVTVEPIAWQQEVCPLLQTTESGQNCTDLIRILHSLPKDHRSEKTIDNLLQWFKNLKNKENRQNFFYALVTVDKDRRAGAIAEALPFVQNILNLQQQISLLFSIEKFTEKGGNNLSGKLSSNTDFFTVKKCVAKLFQWLVEISALERKKEVAESNCKMLKENSGGYIEIYTALFSIPPKEWGAVLPHIVPILGKIQLEKDRIGDLIKALHKIPLCRRQEVVKHILLHPSQNFKVRHAVMILETATFIGPKLLEAFISHVVSSNESCSTTEIVKNFLQKDRNYLLYTKNYLYTKLISLEDSGGALDFSLKVIENQRILFLTSNDEVLNLALIVQKTVLNIDHPKNPYKIYEFFQEITKKENIPPYVPFVQEFNGENLQFSLEMMQQMPRHQTQTFFQDMPEFSLPEHLFNQFDERLEGLSGADREECKKYIEEKTGRVYDALRFDMLKSSYIVNQFCRDKPEVPASTYYVYFARIMKYIAELDNEVLKGKALSPREEALLQFSAVLSDCVEGKKGAFRQFFFVLFSEENQNLSSQDLNRAKEYIFGLMQTTIRELLSQENALTRELSGVVKGTISQFVHQQRYIENLLGRLVGLFPFEQEPEFDSGTLALYDHLLKLKPEEALSIFLRHFTPKYLIETLKKKICEDKLSSQISPKFFNQLYATTQARELDQDGEDIEDKDVLEILKKWGVLVNAPPCFNDRR